MRSKPLISNTENKSLYYNYLDKMQLITHLISSLDKTWCMGRQITVEAIRWAFGRFEGAEDGSPR